MRVYVPLNAAMVPAQPESDTAATAVDATEAHATVVNVDGISGGGGLTGGGGGLGGGVGGGGLEGGIGGGDLATPLKVGCVGSSPMPHTPALLGQYLKRWMRK